MIRYMLWTLARNAWCPLVGHSFKPVRGIMTIPTGPGAACTRITHICWCGAELIDKSEVLQGTRGVMG